VNESIVDDSTITNSNVDNSTVNSSTIINGEIINSIITDCVLINTTVTDSILINVVTIDGTTNNVSNSTLRNINITSSNISDSFVIDSTINYSTITQGSNVTDSVIVDSIIQNTDVENSNVNQTIAIDSNITDSYVDQSNITNSTVMDSTIINSTITDMVLIGQTVVNGVLLSGIEVWDINDSQSIGSLVYRQNETRYFANFTKHSGAPMIEGSCQITFDNSTYYDMSLNISEKTFDYDTSLDIAGLVEYFVNCSYYTASQEISGSLTIYNLDVPTDDEFDGNTTEWATVTDIQNMTNATLENRSAGIIVWNTLTNASEAEFDTNVQILNNYIFINASGLDESFNASADITLYWLSFIKPIILIDRNDNGVYEECKDPECYEIIWDGTNYTFRVSHYVL